jgi:hypothetical protein
MREVEADPVNADKPQDSSGYWLVVAQAMGENMD